MSFQHATVPRVTRSVSEHAPRLRACTSSPGMHLVSEHAPRLRACTSSPSMNLDSERAPRLLQAPRLRACTSSASMHLDSEHAPRLRACTSFRSCHVSTFPDSTFCDHAREAGVRQGVACWGVGEQQASRCRGRRDCPHSSLCVSREYLLLRFFVPCRLRLGLYYRIHFLAPCCSARA
jgi:hypothetical protein